MNKICLAATAAAAFLLSACSTGSKYYQHDGPPSSSAELDTSSATPRVEHFYPASLRPYTVMGQRYVPVTSDVKMDQTGIASWYGKQFHGNKTAIGETYNMHAMSAAHPTMPLPSYARITNLENGRSVIVRVNDRGPFLYNRVMDLSYAAATALDYANKGTARVRVERLTNQEIAAGTWQSGNGLTDPVTNSTQVQAPVQSATPSADAVVTAPAAGWSVQIGFFTERDNALAYAARIPRRARQRHVAQRSARSRPERQGHHRQRRLCRSEITAQVFENSSRKFHVSPVQCLRIHPPCVDGRHA